MFRWAIIFAVIALITALLGFGGFAGLSADFAKILLIVAVVLVVLGFVFGRGGRRTLLRSIATSRVGATAGARRDSRRVSGNSTPICRCARHALSRRRQDIDRCTAAARRQDRHRPWLRQGLTCRPGKSQQSGHVCRCHAVRSGTRRRVSGLPACRLQLARTMKLVVFMRNSAHFRKRSGITLHRHQRHVKRNSVQILFSSTIPH
jgi:uncharacterized membrane protein YtjA (UPF0391 family)